MREIKFRFWDTIKEEMVYETNQIFLTIDGRPHFWTGDKTLIQGKYWMWDLMILQQYTGLKDKNGTEIYEGDICNAGMMIGTIDFIIGGFSLASNTLIEYLPKDACILSPDYDPSWIDVEVIGNIFENKDLLEKEQ